MALKIGRACCSVVYFSRIFIRGDAQPERLTHGAASGSFDPTRGRMPSRLPVRANRRTRVSDSIQDTWPKPKGGFAGCIVVSAARLAGSQIGSEPLDKSDRRSRVPIGTNGRRMEFLHVFVSSHPPSQGQVPPGVNRRGSFTLEPAIFTPLPAKSASAKLMRSTNTAYPCEAKWHE